MSEQALKPVSFGTGSATASAATGRYPVLVGGKPGRATVKTLPEAAAQKPDPERIAQELNIASRSVGRDLRFQVDLDKGVAVIQVLDRVTGEVIRQIPQEKAALIFTGNGVMQIRLFDEMV